MQIIIIFNNHNRNYWDQPNVAPRSTEWEPLKEMATVVLCSAQVLLSSSIEMRDNNFKLDSSREGRERGRFTGYEKYYYELTNFSTE